MSKTKFRPQCKCCGEEYDVNRWKLGIAFCLSCGDEMAKEVASKRCVVAPHKQGYMFFTDDVARDIVKGINNKGGLIR